VLTAEVINALSDLSLLHWGRMLLLLLASRASSFSLYPASGELL
jgi:hypothetical protein